MTCNPVPAGCDYDYLLLLPPRIAAAFCEHMVANGFDIELGAGYAANVLENELNSDAFNSFRCDDVNFIVTCSADFYEKFIVATELAKRFNLLKKPDRIALFQGVLYHNRPAPDLPMFTMPPILKP